MWALISFGKSRFIVLYSDLMLFTLNSLLKGYGRGDPVFSRFFCNVICRYRRDRYPVKLKWTLFTSFQWISPVVIFSVFGSFEGESCEIMFRTREALPPRISWKGHRRRHFWVLRYLLIQIGSDYISESEKQCLSLMLYSLVLLSSTSALCNLAATDFWK